MTIKIENTEAHLTVIYPCIPVIPRVRVVVCHGVPKSSTEPVPALPVLEAPQVNLYPCETLSLTLSSSGGNTSKDTKIVHQLVAFDAKLHRTYERVHVKSMIMLIIAWSLHFVTRG